MIYLKHLILSNNDLQTFPNGFHLGAPSITNITLNKNPIITPRKILGFPNLLNLDLSGCGVSSLPRDFFSEVSKLEILKLDHNSLTTLKEGLFKQLASLKFINLKDNKITDLPQTIFINTPELVHISLESNPLNKRVRIDSIFNNLTKLRELDLTLCTINHLPDAMFTGLDSLRILALSGNRISSWSPRIFKPLKSLTTLVLSTNHINLINKSSVEYLPPSVVYVSLSKNPFFRNCDIFWFTQWMISSNINFMGLEVDNYYACASPPIENGKSLIKYMITTNCFSGMDVKFVLLFTIMICLICATFSIVYHFRWYLKYYYYVIRVHHTRDHVSTAVTHGQWAMLWPIL